MAGSGKTLVIELGVLCNNRCRFCYQRAYRQSKGFEKILPRSEVSSRLGWGRANGYEELSLTGGEPTARPDFLDILAEAKSLGYRRIAVTTNGWKLARPDYFRKAVQAGLTSMGVSIHGLDSATHEALTCRKGSFANAVRAIRNALRTQGTYRVVRLNTFTLVNRLNHHLVPRIAAFLNDIGVRLMIFQPVILSKANVEEAVDLALPLPDVVQAVRLAALLAIERGFRIKLFNLPPCLFRDVAAGLDLQHYELATFREQDTGVPGAIAGQGDQDGYVRLEACQSCAVRRICPGIHVTLVPQEDLVSHIEASIACTDPRMRDRLWLAGTDLLRPYSLYRVVRTARLAGFRSILVTNGGSSVWARTGARAAAEAGASEVVLVHHERRPGSTDRILAIEGNDRQIVRLANDMVGSIPGGSSTRLGILVTPGEQALNVMKNPAITDGLLANDKVVLHIRAPWRRMPLADVKRSMGAFMDWLESFDHPPAERVVVEIPWPRLWEALLGAPVLIVRSPGTLHFDLCGRVLKSALTGPRYSVLNWSIPFIGGGEQDIRLKGCARSDIVSRAVRTLPLTRGDLVKAAGMRYGPRPAR